MYAVICTPEICPQISKAIDVFGEIVFQRSGQFDSAALRSVFQELGRITIDILIFEIESGPTENILPVLRAYRLARPNIRIIVLAPGRSFGDRLISNLLPMHIYDILSPELTEEITWDSLLTQALQSPAATYADAARWHLLDPGLPEIDPSPNKIHSTTQIVYKEKIIGPVIIAVVSLAPGLGCTFNSIALADFLARNSYKVALVELHEGNSFNALANVMGLPVLEDYDGFKLNDFDIYPNGGGQNNLFSRVINRGYNYIVLDCGHFSSVQNAQGISFEIKRANLTIAVGSTTPWRWKDFSPFAKDELDHWKIVIPGGLPEHNKDFTELFTVEKTFFIPLTNSPFTSSDQKDEVFEKLLNPVLPRRSKPKTSGGFSVLDPLKTLLFKNNIS